MQSNRFEPYTYWRSDKRAFLLVGVWDEQPEPYVTVIEWGRARAEGQQITVAVWQQMIESGKLKQFTPTLQA